MASRSRVNRYFFEETNELHDEIISLQEFVLPSATALWNFRSTIEEELRNNPEITAAELAEKYNKAPGTRSTTNLIAPFSKISWLSQRERLAEIALVNIIALYEIWCEAICSRFARDDLVQKLQYPTNTTRSAGVGFALDQIIGGHTGAIAGSIHPSLARSKKYSLTTLDNLLRCFRYFKELRNCFMHRGHKCDGKLFGAQSIFLPVANEKALGMDFVPEHTTANIGNSITVSFHGVLGFTDVILRIATTIDAELSMAPAGEGIFVQRILAARQMPMRRESLRALFHSFGLQKVTQTPELIALLRNNGIIA